MRAVGYVRVSKVGGRGGDSFLSPDLQREQIAAAAPVVLGLFERRARGWSWARLARWAAEQGHPMSVNGVSGLVRNPVYTGQARSGAVARDDAHEAIVPRGLWRRCRSKQRGHRRGPGR